MANLVMPNGKPPTQQDQPVRPAGYTSQTGTPVERPAYTQGQQQAPVGYTSDPQQAQAYWNQRYGQKFGGAQMPQPHQQILAQYAGYTGGPVSQEQWNKADFLFNNWQPGMTQLPTYVPQQGTQAPPGGQSIPTTGSGQTVSNVPPAYQAGQAPQMQPVAQAYQAAQSVNPYQQQQQALMQSILGNPQTMSQTFQDQLFESQKELQGQLQKQGQLAGAQSLASRGLSGIGGTQQQLDSQLQQDMQRNLLAGRRDISTQAAIQNRQDELAALAASGQLQGQDFQQFLAQQGLNRQGSEDQFARDQFTNQFGLQRFGAQEGANQAAAASALQGANFDFQQRDTDRQRLLQEWLARQQAQQQEQELGLQRQQFQGSLGIDLLNYLQGGRQFDTNMAQRIREFNENMGFNWAGQQGQQNQNLLNSVLGIF